MDPPEGEVLLDIERRWLDRWTQGDTSGYLEICAEDVRYFDTFLGQWVDGIETLAAHLEQLRGKTLVDGYDIEDPRVLAVGSAASLTFLWVGHVGDEDIRFAASEIYRLMADGWRIAQGCWVHVK